MQHSSKIVIDYVPSVIHGSREQQEINVLDTIRKPQDLRDELGLIDDDQAETFGLCTNLDALQNEDQEMAQALIKTTREDASRSIEPVNLHQEYQDYSNIRVGSSQEQMPVAVLIESQEEPFPKGGVATAGGTKTPAETLPQGTETDRVDFRIGSEVVAPTVLIERSLAQGS